MQVTDEAIILSIKAHTENSKIFQYLTKGNGIFSGFVRNAQKKHGYITEGSKITTHWKARLEEQIGTLKYEPISGNSFNFLFDKEKSISISCLLQIISSSFPERQHIDGLFDLLENYIISLKESPFDFIKYINAELEILKLSGYELILDKCGHTGNTSDLAYVSPKTGRAISKEAGEEYKHKLLPLPNFQEMNKRNNIINSLNLTGYFFDRYIYRNSKKNLPKIRELLAQ